MKIKIVLFIGFFATLNVLQGQSIISKISVQNKNLIFGSLNKNLYSVSIDSKKTNWTFSAETEIYGQAEVKDNKIYLGDSNGLVYCIGSDGKQIWQKNLGTYEAITHKPIFIDNNLYISSGSSLFILDPRDGSTLGKFYANAPITSPVSTKDNYLLIADNKGKIYKLSKEVALIDSYQIALGAVFGKIIIDENNIFFGSNDSNFYKYSLDGKKVISSVATNDWVSSSPLKEGNLIFFGNDGGFFFCLDKNNMTTKWKFKATASIRTEPLITGDKIFFGSDDKNLYVISKSTGKLIKKFLAKDKIKSSPALIENVVYFADESGEVYAVDTELKALKSIFKTAGQNADPTKTVETVKKN
ncbi:outer membrane protein assembly factor BamB family protein [Flavobacterium foetidum]|uniref:outer membrane protein assembly factor BamB family protein n=1 Tax=Flavobacterium foetidum TaxID=2026681 RepID=UPI0010756571|nr:PQQ-binding-like beta-propeller repeat protein [Flavobacterium foetidum]KAF2516472.1 PQQ-like beta-propeller repeat protein [Flavobacterium foetidum]